MNPATKLDPARVQSLVQSTTYHRSPSGKAVICEIMLVSGYSCIGVARVVDMENDDVDRAKEAAHSRAMDEVWEYAAVMMQQAMHNNQVQSNNKELIAEYIAANGNNPKLI